MNITNTILQAQFSSWFWIFQFAVSYWGITNFKSHFFKDLYALRYHLDIFRLLFKRCSFSSHTLIMCLSPRLSMWRWYIHSSPFTHKTLYLLAKEFGKSLLGRTVKNQTLCLWKESDFLGTFFATGWGPRHCCAAHAMSLASAPYTSNHICVYWRSGSFYTRSKSAGIWSKARGWQIWPWV